MTPKQTCARAAQTIRQYGWRQGDYGSRRTGFCLFGAIEDVSEYGASGLIKTTDYLCEILGLPHTFRSLAKWNDHIHRTKEEVLDLLDKAAA